MNEEEVDILIKEQSIVVGDLIIEDRPKFYSKCNWHLDLEQEHYQYSSIPIKEEEKEYQYYQSLLAFAKQLIEESCKYSFWLIKLIQTNDNKLFGQLEKKSQQIYAKEIANLVLFATRYCESSELVCDNRNYYFMCLLLF
jgi:hypothetical protein